MEVIPKATIMCYKFQMEWNNENEEVVLMDLNDFKKDGHQGVLEKTIQITDYDFQKTFNKKVQFSI